MLFGYVMILKRNVKDVFLIFLYVGKKKAFGEKWKTLTPEEKIPFEKNKGITLQNKAL